MGSPVTRGSQIDCVLALLFPYLGGYATTGPPRSCYSVYVNELTVLDNICLITNKCFKFIFAYIAVTWHVRLLKNTIRKKLLNCCFKINLPFIHHYPDPVIPKLIV